MRGRAVPAADSEPLAPMRWADARAGCSVLGHLLSERGQVGRCAGGLFPTRNGPRMQMLGGPMRGRAVPKSTWPPLWTIRWADARAGCSIGGGLTGAFRQVGRCAGGLFSPGTTCRNCAPGGPMRGRAVRYQHFARAMLVGCPTCSVGFWQEMSENEREIGFPTCSGGLPCAPTRRCSPRSCPCAGRLFPVPIRSLV